MTTYKIIRFYSDGRKSSVRAIGLTLEGAQAWCKREDTHKKDKDGNVIWFDGYDAEKRRNKS